MTTLPPISDFTGSAITEGAFKTSLGTLRGYLAGLLGADGTPATALAALGALGATHEHHAGPFTVWGYHRGRLLTCEGSWTIELSDAADRGAGFAVLVRNAGTGTITIAPHGAQEINGAGSLALEAGQGGAVVCTGAGWHYVGQAEAAIVEADDLASGSYLRFRTGLQLCWQGGFSDTATTQAGAVFRNAGVPWTFPAPFSAAPVAVASAGYSYAWGSVFGTSATSTTLVIWSDQERLSPIPASAIAIGTWS